MSTVETRNTSLFEQAIAASNRQNELSAENLIKDFNIDFGITEEVENRLNTYGDRKSVREEEKRILKTANLMGEQFLDNYKIGVSTVHTSKDAQAAMMRLEILHKLYDLVGDQSTNLADFFSAIDNQKKYSLGITEQMPIEQELAKLLADLNIKVNKRDMEGDLVADRTETLSIGNASRYLNTKNEDIVSGADNGIRTALESALKEEISKLQQGVAKYQETAPSEALNTLAVATKGMLYQGTASTLWATLSERQTPAKDIEVDKKIAGNKKVLKALESGRYGSYHNNKFIPASTQVKETRINQINQAIKGLKKTKSHRKLFTDNFIGRFWRHSKAGSWLGGLMRLSRFGPGIGFFFLAFDLAQTARGFASDEHEGTWINSAFNAVASGNFKKGTGDVLEAFTGFRFYISAE